MGELDAAARRRDRPPDALAHRHVSETAPAEGETTGGGLTQPARCLRIDRRCVRRAPSCASIPSAESAPDDGVGRCWSARPSRGPTRRFRTRCDRHKHARTPRSWSRVRIAASGSGGHRVVAALPLVARWISTRNWPPMSPARESCFGYMSSTTSVTGREQHSNASPAAGDSSGSGS